MWDFHIQDLQLLRGPKGQDPSLELRVSLYEAMFPWLISFLVLALSFGASTPGTSQVLGGRRKPTREWLPSMHTEECQYILGIGVSLIVLE